jgi:subtilisin family serine protease
MNRIIYALFFLVFTGMSLQAQKHGKIIIYKPSVHLEMERLQGAIVQLGLDRKQVIENKKIFDNPLIYSLRIPEGDLNTYKTFLSAYPGMEWVVEDQPLRQRFTPDDAYFDEQWYLDRIQALESWNIAKGGLSPNGDTIVVAILDDGFYSEHEDLLENIWYNRQEIPNDGIDNDLNGYVDDFKGLNVGTGDDVHNVKEHGTAVAGIAGARGDNGIGTAGVALNVKLLLISDATSIANVIEGYNYVKEMRKRYNESGGTQGAFIVATNLSAGINRVFPGDSPVYQQWCNVYNALGEVGVLNINSTTNSNTNIDVDGDMPGTCPSDYLLVVTNSNQFDEKVNDAGYGLTSVDMAAPGVDILTSGLADGYSTFSGASSSAPQVTGAIALIYNAPCDVFAQESISDPASAALKVKEMLMHGVDTIPGLADDVKSSGRLNILKSLAKLRDYCGGTTGELEVLNAWPNPVSNVLYVHYEAENYYLHSFELSNTLGQMVYRERFHPDYFGDKVYEFDLGELNLPNGMYVATIKSDEALASVKIWIGSVGQ